MFVTEEFELPNQFPIAMTMRVLAVDHDKKYLLHLRNFLSCCQFEDVTVTLADKSSMTLELVKDKKNKFDLIIIEKEMPDMDGFNFLQLITLETDTPVILTSSSTNPELMEKAIRFGAYFVLAKPLTIEMLNNTCLYVLTKHKVESEKRDISENVNELEANDVSIISKSKRKIEDSTNQKKARVDWTIELDKKFVDAVKTLEANGGKAVPKKILELMNVENLTKGNVASHLQKYRISKIEEAARNNDSSLAIHAKTIQTKTRRMPARKPRTHFSKMSYNNSYPQPNPLHHQSGQVISSITPIPASGTFLQTSNEMRKNQRVPLDCFDQMFFNNSNNNSLPMAAPNNSFLAENQQQVPSYANGNILQQLQLPPDNFDHLYYSLPMRAPSNSFLAGNQQQSGFSNQYSGFNVPNNQSEVPLETNLDANQTGLYGNMEFGDDLPEMNPRRDDLVSDTSESYLMDKENELPSGFIDASLIDLFNSCRNN